MKIQTELQITSCVIESGVVHETKECDDVSVDSLEKCSIDFHIVSQIITI